MAIETTKTSEDRRTEILVDNLREALRLGERYLFVSLATSAVAVAALDSKPRAIHLFIVDVDVQATYVSLAALATSWCAAWLSWTHVRHAATLAGVIGSPNVKSAYDAAVAALTYPSLFTVGGSWLRWLIILMMGLLIFSAIAPGFLPQPSWWKWLGLAFLEAPYLMLLVSSGVKVKIASASSIGKQTSAPQPHDQLGQK